MVRNREFGDRTLESLQSTLSNLNKTTEALDGVVQRVDRGEGVLGKLTKDPKLATSLEKAVNSLERVAHRIETPRSDAAHRRPGLRRSIACEARPRRERPPEVARSRITGRNGGSDQREGSTTSPRPRPQVELVGHRSIGARGSGPSGDAAPTHGEKHDRLRPAASAIACPMFEARPQPNLSLHGRPRLRPRRKRRYPRRRQTRPPSTPTTTTIVSSRSERPARRGSGRDEGGDDDDDGRRARPRRDGPRPPQSTARFAIGPHCSSRWSTASSRSTSHASGGSARALRPDSVHRRRDAGDAAPPRSPAL